MILEECKADCEEHNLGKAWRSMDKMKAWVGDIKSKPILIKHEYW